MGISSSCGLVRPFPPGEEKQPLNPGTTGTGNGGEAIGWNGTAWKKCNVCLTFFTKREVVETALPVGPFILWVLNFQSCTIGPWPSIWLPRHPVSETSLQLSSWALPLPIPSWTGNCQSHPELIPSSSVSRYLQGQGVLLSLAVYLHWHSPFTFTDCLRLTPFPLLCAKKVADGWDRGPTNVARWCWGWTSCMSFM